MSKENPDIWRSWGTWRGLQVMLMHPWVGQGRWASAETLVRSNAMRRAVPLRQELISEGQHERKLWTRSLSPHPQRRGWYTNSTHLSSHAWRRPVHPCSLSQGGRLYGKPKANKGKLQPDVGRLSGSLSVPGVGSTCVSVLPAQMEKPEQPCPLKPFPLQWKPLLTFPEPSEQIWTS